jgi:acetylornithine deacetylase/succinyl-diaminopimelate desuccinylase-like protein
VRVLERLDELYAIGGGEGANRPGYSAAEQEAHDLVAGWVEQAGLEVEVDSAGNLFGRTHGELPEVWVGSHLDTVPNGGRFDGALGVVAGLEAIERIGPQRRGIAVVAFRDEERGCFGSRACCERPSALPTTYLEAHVEQGPVLADAGAPLGVVTDIAGIVRGEMVFEGSAGHAGTTPMAVRDDALWAAAEYVLEARRAAEAIEGAVATVGELTVEPGAANVIPSRVRLSVDARAPDRERLDRLIRSLRLQPTYEVAPAAMAEAPRAALRSELEQRGLPVVELASGAGHDAGILAAAGVASGMLFVRSLNGGVSHSPSELSSDEDVALAVDVLAGALARLAA